MIIIYYWDKHISITFCKRSASSEPETSIHYSLIIVISFQDMQSFLVSYLSNKSLSY